MIIELDGEQHFKETKLDSLHETTLFYDVYKMMCALRAVYRFVRISQEDYLAGTYDIVNIVEIEKYKSEPAWYAVSRSYANHQRILDHCMNYDAELERAEQTKTITKLTYEVQMTRNSMKRIVGF